jgi:DNA repair protein RecO (recombination protein O)
MPGLYKDEGVVLKTIKLGEADRIVTMFTRDNGKVRAVAKGIRKTKSRFGGRLEPFTRVALVVYRGRNLDTITSADIIDSFKGVRADYGHLTAAATFAEMVEKITPEGERALSVYRLLLDGLTALGDDDGGTVVPAFLVKLLSLAGYHPQLQVCAGCAEPGPLGAFSSALGGAICEECWSDDRDAPALGGPRIGLLTQLLMSDFGVTADAAAVAEVTSVLGRYAEYHIERPLKSLRLLPPAQPLHA